MSTRSCAISLLMFLFISCIIVAIIIAHFGNSPCLQKFCIKKSKRIIQNLDSNSDPCKSFYKFACGKSSIESPGTSTFHQISNKTLLFLETLQKEGRGGNVEYKIRKFSEKCRNELTIITNELATKVITRSLGLVLNATDHINLFKYLTKSRKIGFMPQILTWRVLQDPDRPGDITVSISFPKYGSPPLKFGNIMNVCQQKYAHRRVIALIFHNFFGERKDLHDNKTLESLASLDCDIASAAQKSKHSIEKKFITSIDKLKVLLPLIDWKELLNNFLFQGIQAKTTIILNNKSYFEALNEIIKKTDKFIFYLLLVFNNIRGFMPFFPPAVSEHDQISYFTYVNMTEGLGQVMESSNVKFEVCENLVKYYFTGALISLSIEAFSIEDSGHDTILFITKELKNQMKEVIQHSTLRDKMTAENALLKLNQAKYFLSVSDEKFRSLKNSKTRILYYLEFCIDQTSFISTMLCANKFLDQKKIELAKWKREVSGFDAEIPQLSPKIHYDPDENELVVPSVLLQFPGFIVYWPVSVKFGTIGTVISAELIKGFITDNGQCYEEDSQSSFNMSTYDPRKHKECTLSNVNQTMAVKVAYTAYKNYTDKIGFFSEEFVLPRLDSFSRDQMFFISYANLYCFKSYNLTVEEIKLRNARKAMVDSLLKLKVFKDAFGCK